MTRRSASSYETPKLGSAATAWAMWTAACTRSPRPRFHCALSRFASAWDRAVVGEPVMRAAPGRAGIVDGV